ncbi:craniofacial development protein 1 isoform X1 [Phyllopteryx taeniolatus]|uniref:craniofacial development protein 1 isoform X1 n=1 Tax=Phyllopteryx taeniolatus TaxID=161469 RepID=UPI002AD2A9CE|nr:craniofacial development protein 1 isoform X1 [Phyllopteryx taeniolatus]
MNYSDDDSDGYSSSEDADYAPSDDNVSEDDINECEKEEPSDESDGVPHPDNVTKRSVKKNGSSLRKRPKRVLKVDGEEKNGGGTEEARPLQEDVEKLTQIQNDDEATQKKQSDDLWARFLSDVAPRPKASMGASPTHTTPEAHSLASSVCMRTESQESDPAKVTIVKVFDFAGEEIRVNKEVLADSKEAKIHLKSQCTKEKMGEKKPTSPSQSTCPGPSVSSSKRPAGMSGLLSRIGGKKQRISTLEKSKMDWDAFKYEEGITEELAIHNRGRDGYVERKNFLERVDHRQFEMEKEVRLKNMKHSS